MKKGIVSYCILIVLFLFAACGNQQETTEECLHSYGMWVIKQEASCSANGVQNRVCEKCGYLESEAIMALPHIESGWIVAQEPTCAEKGSRYKECQTCGIKIQTEDIELTPHVKGEWNVVNPATCVADGLEQIKCTVCDVLMEERIIQASHTEGEWIVDKEETCTETGNRHKECTVCGEIVKTEEIQERGHNEGSWKTTKEATCTKEGSKQKKCTVCGEIIKTEKITATGHSWKEATCTTAKTCKTCGKTEGSALGHSKNSSGYCSRCKETIEVDMETLVGKPSECDTISYFGFSYYKNSVDGIKLCWGGENLSGKTVNYYTITLYFYNRVGDPAYDEITGQSKKTLKYVGPIEPNEDFIIYDIVGYFPVGYKIVVGDITLEYADGTSDTGWYGYYTTTTNSALK